MLDLVGAAAIGRRQDYLGAPYVLLFGVAIPDDGLQPKAIPRRDSEADSCSHARLVPAWPGLKLKKGEYLRLLVAG